MALLSDSDIGIFVASNGFTRDAEIEARRQATRRIMLIDSERPPAFMMLFPDIPATGGPLSALAVHFV